MIAPEALHCVLEVARIADHVEQRVREAIGGEPRAIAPDQLGSPRKLERTRLVLLDILGNELGQADGLELAASDAAHHRLAGAGEHGQSTQERIVRGRVRAIRIAVEKEVRDGIACRVLCDFDSRREN